MLCHEILPHSYLPQLCSYPWTYVIVVSSPDRLFAILLKAALRPSRSTTNLISYDYTSMLCHEIPPAPTSLSYALIHELMSLLFLLLTGCLLFYLRRHLDLLDQPQILLHMIIQVCSAMKYSLTLTSLSYALIHELMSLLFLLLTGCLLFYLRRHLDLLDQPQILVHMIIQVCSAMKYLEKKHFIHRDLVSWSKLVVVTNISRIVLEHLSLLLFLPSYLSLSSVWSIHFFSWVCQNKNVGWLKGKLDHFWRLELFWGVFGHHFFVLEGSNLYL